MQSTIIDTGTIAGQALTWAIVTFGGVIAAALTNLLLKMARNAGVIGAGLLRDHIQEMILNGLNAGAAQAAKELAGKGQIAIKNAAVSYAVQYVQAHGADTLKKLGDDPMAQATVEKLKARIETAIVDPTIPTHPALDPAPVDPSAQQAPKG